MKWIFSFFLILALYTTIKGQSYQAMNAILSTSFKEVNVKFQREKNYYLSTLDYTVPFIEKVEFRTETNDFDLRKQDYTIRVSPNSRSNIKSYRSYHQSVQFMSKMEYNTQLLQSLNDNYQLITQFVFIQEQLRLEKEKEILVRDKIKLFKKMISLASFNILDLIETEDELYRLQRVIREQEINLEQTKARLEAIIMSEIQLDLSDFISVQSIKTLLLSGALDTNSSHPEQEVLSAKHYNIMMQYEWEASKNDFNVGFIQASYGHRPEDPFRSNFSLGMGFDFPLKGSSALELNERKVDILDAQSEYLQKVENNKIQKQATKSKLESLISMYELLSFQIKEGNAEYALKEYSKRAVASPKALLRMKELNVNNEALLTELYTEIIKCYLEYIYTTGVMGITPYKNYLVENLHLILN